MLASYVTGLVRAALSEAVATLPDHAIVATATTDGFLSSVPVEHIDVSGPVATAFAKTRTRIDGDPTIWETKHVIGRALVTKTRGTITAEGIDGEGGDPVLARAGYKFEDRPADPWDECERWIEVYGGRDYETHSRRSSLTSLREQWREEADVVEVLTDVRLNLDFDLKREIIDPTDCEGLLSADTRPWRTLEDFTRARDGLEAWKKAQRRVLKTCPPRPAPVALPRPPVPLRGDDGAHYPNLPPSDREPVLPLVRRPRLLRVLQPQRPTDFHHQRRSKDIDRWRVAAGHPGARRPLQPVDDPTLHRVARRGAAEDRGACLSRRSLSEGAMSNPSGQNDGDFDGRLGLQFRGSVMTSDAGLLNCRELDDALGLTGMANEVLAEARTGKNGRHGSAGLLWRAVFGRLAGYEDVVHLANLGLEDI